MYSYDVKMQLRCIASRQFIKVAALGGLEIPHGQLQSQTVLLAPQQDGTK